MFFLDYLILVVGVLLGLAFFTLVERKILGYIHFRKGPTKLFYFGLLQPISDAVKLFSKEFIVGFGFSFFLFMTGPVLGFFLMLVLWVTYGSYFGLLGGIFSIVYVFCFLSLGVYFLLFCGWGSSSKYALLGGYRAVSQSLSYEVSMIFFILVFTYFISFFDLRLLFFWQLGYWFIFLSFGLFVAWLFVILSESNRTPFDFSEGESELVSGFNVEYGGGTFSLIFICEYGMILFLCFISSYFFLGGVSFFLKIICMGFFFVWVRCCFPRYRYDFLMDSAWKTLLPFSLVFLFLSISFF
uniref:NADH dehydrogenase subunit 1 n=1 Tax=Ceratozetella imperatoria TaxID=3127034 RepID=UPI00315DA7E2